MLRSALAPLSHRIAFAFIYGSIARNEEKAESDIDLLIVGKVALEDVLARLSDVESSLGRAVNLTVYSVAEFKTKLGNGNLFLNAVLRGEEIFLIETKMSLEKWAEYGWLTAEPTGRNEIKSLLAIVCRDLKDAGVAAISDDRRFEAAFSAARTAASIALRASGYRTVTQVGHHAKTIESLALSIKADSKMIQKLRTFSKKRKVTSYDSAGQCIKAGTETSN